MRALCCSILLLSLGCGRVVDDRTNLPPIAEAGGDRRAAPGAAVVFDGSASRDDDGEVVGHQWTFPGGEKVEGEVVERAFDAGVHVVTLEVFDDDGATGRAEILVEVNFGPPSAQLSASATAVQVGEEVLFDASASTADVPIARFQWSFGDGSVGEGPTAAHRFTQSGAFTVRVVVEDEDGRRADAELTIDVAPLDVDGDYDLVFERTTFSCAEYAASFDESELSIVRTGETIALTFGSGLTMTGTELDGRVTASQTWIEPTGGGCIQAPVDGAASLVFDGNDFSGSVSLFYDLAVPCQCSALFNLSGTRR